MLKPIHALGLGAGMLLATVPVIAQQPDENLLCQPLVSADGSVRDDAFIRIPLRPEDQAYADIEGGRMKEILMEVDAISIRDRDAGTVFWGRNVGTDGHVWTQDWVDRYFEQIGRAYAAIIDAVNRLDRSELQPVTASTTQTVLR